VRPPAQSDSRVATRGNFTVLVRFLLRGDRFEGRMEDETITTESSHGRVGSVDLLSTGLHPKTGVHTVQSCLIYTYSRVLGHGQTLKTCSFLMFWDFYLPLQLRVW
jgi:hypothetical protein